MSDQELKQLSEETVEEIREVMQHNLEILMEKEAFHSDALFGEDVNRATGKFLRYLGEWQSYRNKDDDEWEFYHFLLTRHGVHPISILNLLHTRSKLNDANWLLNLISTAVN